MEEHCQICGEEYSYVWTISDELWEKVTGIKNGGGLQCIHCFEREADKKGIIIYWFGKEVTK